MPPGALRGGLTGHRARLCVPVSTAPPLTIALPITWRLSSRSQSTTRRSVRKTWKTSSSLTPGNLYHFVWQVGRGDTGATVEVYSRLITVTPWHGV